jgi:hypothetical protein
MCSRFEGGRTIECVPTNGYVHAMYTLCKPALSFKRYCQLAVQQNHTKMFQKDWNSSSAIDAYQFHVLPSMQCMTQHTELNEAREGGTWLGLWPEPVQPMEALTEPSTGDIKTALWIVVGAVCAVCVARWILHRYAWRSFTFRRRVQSALAWARTKDAAGNTADAFAQTENDDVRRKIDNHEEREKYFRLLRRLEKDTRTVR